MNREEHVLLIAEIVQKQRRDGLSELEVKKATKEIAKILVDDGDIDEDIANKTIAIIFNESIPSKKTKTPKTSTASTTSAASAPTRSTSYGSCSGSVRGGC